MTLRTWLADKLQPQRVQQFPPAIMGEGFFGASAGLSNQPSAKRLLRESLGVADTATRAIANRVASIEPLVKVKRKESEGTVRVETIDDHPLKLLLDRPNPTFSRTQLLRLTAQYLVTVGDAMWIKVGSQLGRTVELYPVIPSMYEPVVRKGIVESYLLTEGTTRRREIPASDVVRFFFPDPENPYKGEGYLGPNAIETDAQKFAAQQLRSHFENDATPPILLKASEGAPAPTPEEWKSYLYAWRQSTDRRRGEFSGLPNRLPEGWDFDELTRDSGADVAPLLTFWLESQLMNFGTPASVLGRVVSGDRSSAETNQFVFDRHTILPITNLISDAITLQLAPEFDSEIFVQFEQFVSADKVFDLKREEQDLKTKVRSVNQVLSDRNADPVDWGEEPIGTFADVVFDPEDSFRLPPDTPEALRSGRGRAGNDTDEAGIVKALALIFSAESAWQRAKKAERAFTPKFERRIRSIIEAQRKETLKRLKAKTPRARISGEDLFNPDDWVRDFRERVGPLMRTIFQKVGGDTLNQLTGADFIFSQEVVDNLEREAVALAQQTGRTTLSAITRALSAESAEGASIDQMARIINSEFGTRRKHAVTIARTEVLKANQAAQIEGFTQSGVVERKQWNTALDSAVRDSHVIDGQIVPLNDSFTLNDGERALHPGGAGLSAGNVINCRCFVTPVFEGE